MEITNLAQGALARLSKLIAPYVASDEPAPLEEPSLTPAIAQVSTHYGSHSAEHMSPAPIAPVKDKRA